MLTKILDPTTLTNFKLPFNPSISTENPVLTKNQEAAIVGRLNGLLADNYLIMLKTQNYNWNVEGDKTVEFKNVAEECYNQIFETVDYIAKRVRDLNHEVAATFQEFQESGNITEAKKGLTSEEMISDVLESHQDVIIALRESLEYAHECGDKITIDLLLVQMELHERCTWAYNQISYNS